MDTPLKTVYYNDFSDDFAGTNIDTKPVPADFPYLHDNIVWRVIQCFVYHCIARPLVWLIAKLYLGMRVRGRSNLRGLHSPFFLYGNHTHTLDAFIPSTVCRPRRANIICSADTVSIPGLRCIVQMLGALPVPSSVRGTVSFRRAIEEKYRSGGCIAVYPEAHIWPYCKKIRPFSEASFSYPAEYGAPVVAMVTTYRRRTGLFRFVRRPAMTVTLSEPMHPDMSLDRRTRARELRDRVFAWMDGTAREIDGVEYIRYEPSPAVQEDIDK